MFGAAVDEYVPFRLCSFICVVTMGVHLNLSRVGSLLIFLLVFLYTFEGNCQLQIHRSRRAVDGQDSGILVKADNDCNDEDFSEDNNVPGVCKTFNSKCICELNPNCIFDTKAAKCISTTDCSMYNNLAVACRTFHCNYDCATGVCRRFQDYARPCSSDKFSCHQFCSDICACNTMECQLSLDGRCQSTKERVCDESLLELTKCGRPNAFYLTSGVLCKNIKPKGNCEIEKTLIAINLGGKSYTGVDGILYAADKAIFYNDIHNIRKEYLAKDPVESTSKDIMLYQTIVYADSSKRENGRCIVYNFAICDEGFYELSIKTIEFFDVRPGEKTFNIKLYNQYIFAELDVANIAGKRNFGVEIIMNFKVVDKQIVVKDLPPIKITNGTVPLSFCFGECLFAEGYFEIAAFAVNKLVDPFYSPPNVPCNLFNGNHWKCIHAFCKYNFSSEVCHKQEAETCVEEICPSMSPNVELMFLLDGSGSQARGPINDTYSVIFDIFSTKLVEIAFLIREAFPDSKFGITLFTDFDCVRWNLCGQNEVHDDPKGCYRLQSNLNSDISILKADAQRSKLKIKYSHNKEPGLFSVMMTAEDRRIKWTRGNPSSSVVKIIAVITDDGLHTSSPNWKTLAKYDGTDNCEFTLHPSAWAIDQYLLKERISLFFMFSKTFDQESYDAEVRRMKTPHAYSDMFEPPMVLANKLIKFILQQSK